MSHKDIIASYKGPIIEMLRQRSYNYTHGEPYILASGEKSRHYVDVRKTALHGEGVMRLSRVILTLLQHGSFGAIDAVAGVALGGCPLATGVSLFARLEASQSIEAIYVRKVGKEHGTKKLVEHPFLDVKLGRRVMLLEDVVTSGGSSIQAALALEEEGFEVAGIIAVVDRRKDKIDQLGNWPFVALITLEELTGGRT